MKKAGSQAGWHFPPSLPAALSGLILSIFLHYERRLDWLIQGFFLRNGRWLIDGNEPMGKALFYTGPKALLVMTGLAILWRRARCRRHGTSPTRPALRTLLCLAAIPICISTAKSLTHEPCPKELALFGGSQFSPQNGKCFPAGHASGGFALIALYWYWDASIPGALIGLAAGSTLGLYQMAKGAHFLSDTLATGFFAWAFCLIVFRIYSRKESSMTSLT